MNSFFKNKDFGEDNYTAQSWSIAVIPKKMAKVEVTDETQVFNDLTTRKGECNITKQKISKNKVFYLENENNQIQ